MYVCMYVCNLFFIISSPFPDWLKFPGLLFITRRPLPYLEVWGNLPYDGTLIVPICIRNLWFQGSDAVIKLFWHVCRIQENGRNCRITAKNWTKQTQEHKNITLSIGAVYIYLFSLTWWTYHLITFFFHLLFLFSFERETHFIQCSKSKFHRKTRSPWNNQYFSALPCMASMHLFAILAK